MKHLEVKATALTWSTLDLHNHLNDGFTAEEEELFKKKFGGTAEDYQAYLESFFEIIADGLIEQINGDLHFQIREDINNEGADTELPF